MVDDDGQPLAPVPYRRLSDAPGTAITVSASHPQPSGSTEGPTVTSMQLAEPTAVAPVNSFVQPSSSQTDQGAALPEVSYTPMSQVNVSTAIGSLVQISTNLADYGNAFDPPPPRC